VTLKVAQHSPLTIQRETLLGESTSTHWLLEKGNNNSAQSISQFYCCSARLVFLINSPSSRFVHLGLLLSCRPKTATLVFWHPHSLHAGKGKKMCILRHYLMCTSCMWHSKCPRPLKGNCCEIIIYYDAWHTAFAPFCAQKFLLYKRFLLSSDEL
jgi:hypothetical protein